MDHLEKASIRQNDETRQLYLGQTITETTTSTYLDVSI